MTKHIIIASFALFFIFSCSVTKRLPEGQYLLTSNDLSVNYDDTLSKKYKIDKGTIKEYIPMSQIPNSKIFGYNLSLKIHQMANPESNSWGNRVLRKIGQTPVIYDSLSNIKALKNLKLYMNSEGFYNSKVTDTVIYKKRRAYVKYHIDAGAPYFIKSYSYNFLDSTVMPYVLTKDFQSLIKGNMMLKHSLLENERLRITNSLQEDGFYYFSVGSVDYLIDTSKSNANIIVNINQRIVDRERRDHRIYKIGDIKVMPSNRSIAYLNNPNPPIKDVIYDSILYAYPTIIKSVRPKILSDLITIAPGDIVKKDLISSTKNRLNSLTFFRSVNLDFKDNDKSSPDDKIGTLDCNIHLLQELQQGFKADAEIATNTSYSGFSLTLGYTNKNIFKGGETFNFSVTGGYDFVRGNEGKDSWEIGGNISLSFPRFISPFKLQRIRSLSGISTDIEMLINSQRRPYYDRTITTLSYGYQWNSRKKFSYLFRPITISLINVPWKDPNYINSISNPYLRESYNSQLIAGSNFSVLYKNSLSNTHKISVRTNVETSGNLLYLGSKAFHAKKQVGENNQEYYDIFNINYSQYIRPEVIFTYEFKASKNVILAYRFYGGGGYAYANSKVLPVERRFYAGGGSSMRGWQVRTLGPGTIPEKPNALFPDQLGNIRLETNLEARFPIYKIVRGAIFFDLGNIWSNIKGDEADNEARFYFNEFYKQLAFNTGAGLRLDFNFFVVRMDWGIQLHNPGKPVGERWIDSFNFKNTALHFGIGYPF